MHRECNLTKRVQTAKGDRFCPVVLHKNGKVKSDYVLVEGVEKHHPEGTYYIEWREDGKRKRLSVGRDPIEAATQPLRKEAELNARNNGLGLTGAVCASKRPLQAAIEKYLELAKRHKPKTLAAYTVALRYFTESCSKQYVEDVSREDLLAFSIFLRDKKKQAPRSVANKFENTMTFLKSQGVRGLIGKNDWPRYVEQEPEIYEREELDALFAACDENERGSNFSL